MKFKQSFVATTIAAASVCMLVTAGNAQSKGRIAQKSEVSNGDSTELVSPGAVALNSVGASTHLNLEQAIRVAIVHNRSLATATANLLKSQGRTAEAKAALNPTASLDTALTEFDDKTSVTFGGANITTLNQFNPVITAGAMMPIDILGLLHDAVTQSQFQQAAARIDINRIRNSVVSDVKTSFINVLRGQAQLNVANDTLNNARLRKDTAQKSFDAGTAPRFDIIRADTDVANAQRSVIEATTALKLSLALLKNVMGVDISLTINVTSQNAIVVPNIPPIHTPITSRNSPVGRISQIPEGSQISVGSLVPTEVNDTLDLGPEYSVAVAEAIKTRPEILGAQANLSAARQGIKLARKSVAPRVGLNLGYTLTPNNTVFSRENVIAGTVDINIPLYDGGVARAHASEAKAEVSAAETAKREAIDGVTLEVQQAYIAMIQAKERIAVAEVGLTQAREAARLARVRYSAGVSQQTGVSPLLELSDSENSLSTAEFNKVNAVYDYNSSLALLDRAVGRYSYDRNGRGFNSLNAASKAAGTSKGF